MAEIRWHGHTCFRIKAKEATIILDPVDRTTGYALGKQNADIVTISGDPGGKNLGAIRPDYQVIDGPGEYEMHDVFVTGGRTYQDTEKGAVRGFNTTYVVEVEGLKFGHLGNIGHALTEAQSEALEDVDVLMVPAGGDDILSHDLAADLVTTLTPKLVIPMRYATSRGDAALGSVTEFCKKLGVEIPEVEDKLTIRPSDLSETMRLVVLNPDGEAVKR
jgi:L-ascorbate metabolism protein UlaG (beta-lactamase superfamily)